MKIIWYMIPEIWSTTDRTIFCPFKYTKNHDHMLYCFWDMVCDTSNSYFSFWAIFLPFYPPPPLSPFPNSPKNQNFKIYKKKFEISSFYTSVPKIMIRWYAIPEIWYATDGYTDGCTDRQTDKKSDI